MRTSTIRHGASRSKRRCGPHRGQKSTAHTIVAEPAGYQLPRRTGAFL
jgi:hypothetical protein